MANEDKKRGNGKYLSSTTLISAGTSIKGAMNCAGDLRIDGEVQGDISSEGKVIIGNNGSIVGNINANNIEIMGKVAGNVSSNDKLGLLESGSLKGDIKAKHITIEETAQFNGMCVME